jgi:hypothetical protein
MSVILHYVSVSHIVIPPTLHLCVGVACQGTNRPGRYNVLLDDSRLGPDGLQLITQHLASTYAPCTRCAAQPWLASCSSVDDSRCVVDSTVLWTGCQLLNPPLAVLQVLLGHAMTFFQLSDETSCKGSGWMPCPACYFTLK